MIFLKIALVFELSTYNLGVTVGDHFLGEFLFSLNPTEMRIKASAENNFGLN